MAALLSHMVSESGAPTLKLYLACFALLVAVMVVALFVLFVKFLNTTVHGCDKKA